MSLRRFLNLFVGCSAGFFLCSCGTTDTWIGRRWHVQSAAGSCRFWGYVKRPGERWQAARLIILDERHGVSPPDRAPVAPGPPFYGDDHNCEYEMQGRLTGELAYDPNSDLELPLFAAGSFRLLSRNPGPFPGVGFPRDNGFVPAREAPNRLSGRLR